MINDWVNYTPERLQSQVVQDPSQQYQSWLQDWQNRYNAEQAKAGQGASAGSPAGMSVADAIKGITSDYVNSYMGGPDYANALSNLQTTSGVNGAPTVATPSSSTSNANLNDTYGSIFQGAYNVAHGGHAGGGWSDDFVTQAAQDALGPGLNTALMGYSQDPGSSGSPSYVPDFSSLNAEKSQAENAFSTSLNNQKSLQNAYTSQLGGGYAGGVLPDPSQAFAVAQVGQTDPTTGQPVGGSTGQPTATMPWATPGYSSGGLGGLGGYNPNPWNTAGTSAAQTSNPWGGPFGAKNPYAPGS